MVQQLLGESNASGTSGWGLHVRVRGVEERGGDWRDFEVDGSGGRAEHLALCFASPEASVRQGGDTEVAVDGFGQHLGALDTAAVVREQLKGPYKIVFGSISVESVGFDRSIKPGGERRAHFCLMWL